MNATVTVALERTRALNPTTTAEKQPGSWRIMNHEGTRLSCLSHGSIEVKQAPRAVWFGAGKATKTRAEIGQGRTRRR